MTSRSTLRVLGGVAFIIGSGALAALGVWSLILDLRVAYTVAGPWLVVVGAILFPVTIIAAPLYAGVRQSDWFPALVSIASIAIPWPVIATSVVLLRRARRA
jgi:hypothetical protein